MARSIFLLGLVVLALIAGCTGSEVARSAPSTITPIAVTWSRDDWAPAPSVMTSSPVPHIVASVAWDEQGRILLTTWWSSSCPQLPVGLDLVAPDELAVTVAQLDTNVGPDLVPTCTADLSATTSVLDVPAGLDSTGSVTVRVGDLTLTLPTRA